MEKEKEKGKVEDKIKDAEKDKIKEKEKIKDEEKNQIKEKIKDEEKNQIKEKDKIKDEEKDKFKEKEKDKIHDKDLDKMKEKEEDEDEIKEVKIKKKEDDPGKIDGTRTRDSSESNLTQLNKVKRTLSFNPTGTTKEIAFFNENYELQKKIGEGSFGSVYKGLYKTNGVVVAIKTESLSVEDDDSSLMVESEIYEALRERIGSNYVGIPKVYYYGEIEDRRVLVMEMLGPNLENLFDVCERKFTLKTVTMIALQLIDRIHSVHKARMIHRDIKAENFCMGVPSENNAKIRNMIRILDFGLARDFIDELNQHIPEREGLELIGTVRYMSIRTQDGMEQSRRDDLESIGHLIIYFATGKLPWQSVKVANPNNLKGNALADVRYKMIGHLKKNTPIDRLCHGLPKEFATFLDYARNKLTFEQEPDYDMMRELFHKVMRDNKFEYDSVYDWDRKDKSGKWRKKNPWGTMYEMNKFPSQSNQTLGRNLHPVLNPKNKASKASSSEKRKRQKKK